MRTWMLGLAMLMVSALAAAGARAEESKESKSASVETAKDPASGAPLVDARGNPVPKPTMIQTGEEGYFEIFLLGSGGRRKIDSRRDDSGAINPLGDSMEVGRGGLGLALGKRAVNGFGGRFEFRMQSAGVRESLGTVSLGDEIIGEGVGLGGSLFYGRDLLGKRELRRWVWGFRLGIELDYSYEVLEHDRLLIEGNLEDARLRPFGNIVGAIDNGRASWELYFGPFINIDLVSEYTDTSPANPNGDVVTKFKSDSPIGADMGFSVGWDAIRLSFSFLVGANDQDSSLRFGFAFLF